VLRSGYCGKKEYGACSGLTTYYKPLEGKFEGSFYRRLYISQDNVKLLLGETLAFAGHTTALTWPQQ